MRKLLMAAALLISSTVGANAMLITGSYSAGGTGGQDVTNIMASPFSFDLTVGHPQTFDLVNFFGTSNGASLVGVGFSFDLPSTGDSSIVGLDLMGSLRSLVHDSIDWAHGGKLEIDFANGAILDVLLDRAAYNGLKSNYEGLDVMATFELIRDPLNVPEPATIALLGTGLIGFAAFRRRRKDTTKAV